MRRLVILGSSLLVLSLAYAQSEQSTQPRMGVLFWGDNSHGQCQAPPLSSDAKHVQIACGTSHTLALQSNGQLVAWGANDFGQGIVPLEPAGATYQRIAASDHNLALRNDGTLLAWGRNDFGQCDVPALPRGMVWSAISAGARHSAALRSDGTILCWGDDSSQQCDIPKPPLGLSYVAVSAGARHTAALRSDGHVICWGENALGQCEIPPIAAEEHVLSISAGGAHTLALTVSGRLFAWGSNKSGECAAPPRPYGRQWVEIAAGARHSLARLDDGSVMCWGADDLGQCTPPKKLVHFDAVRISAGGQHNAVLFQAFAPDVQPVCLGDGSAGPCPCGNEVPAGQLSGCGNSTKSGAALGASGHARVLEDDLYLVGSSLPPTIAVVLQCGLDPTSGAGNSGSAPFGDGILCLRGRVLRLGTVNAGAGNFVFPDVGTPPLSLLGRIRGPCELDYQVWYRDPQPVCRGDGSNTTNALRVRWSM